MDSFAKSELLMDLFGLILFLILTLATLRGLFSLVRFTLSTALTVEGYLVGFQLFVVKDICHFCFTVFLLLVAANLTMLLCDFKREKRNLWTDLLGFSGFFSILFMTWFVNPGISPLPNEKLVIIHSPTCPHCQDIIKFCEKNKIKASFVKLNNEKGLCRSLNITEVPILIKRNNRNSIQIAVGEREIKKLLKSNRKDNTKKNTSKEKHEEILSPLLNDSSGACYMFGNSECNQ